MKFKEVVNKIESNSEFKSWKKENKEYYLAHGFKMLDKDNDDVWQVGYYNDKKDKMTTFYIEGDDIRMAEDLNVFKKPEANVKELKIEDVKIDVEKALGVAEEFQKEEYKGNEPVKAFFIIQNLDIGPVFNITYVTQTFSTLNMKVCCKEGKVLKHKLTPLMQFGNVVK